MVMRQLAVNLHANCNTSGQITLTGISFLMHLPRISKTILGIFVLFALFYLACTKEQQNAFNYLHSNISHSKPVATHYSVTEFGAKGDGSDDTKALQDAINSGKPLLFPKGVYMIYAPLAKKSGTIDIVFEAGAVIKIAPSFPSGKTIYHGAFAFEDLNSVRLTGVVIDVNLDKLKNI